MVSKVLVVIAHLLSFHCQHVQGCDSAYLASGEVAGGTVSNPCCVSPASLACWRGEGEVGTLYESLFQVMMEELVDQQFWSCYWEEGGREGSSEEARGEDDFEHDFWAQTVSQPLK